MVLEAKSAFSMTSIDGPVLVIGFGTPVPERPPTGVRERSMDTSPSYTLSELHALR
jgi:hypothetical protein